jgi:arsenate reductase
MYQNPSVAAAGHTGMVGHMEIWLNPACSKCRAATEALDEAGVEYQIRRYLDDPPTAAELSDVLDRLGLEPWDITRLGEAVATELDLASMPRTEGDRASWISLLVANPVLIQRPIITAADGTTVVGRTPQSLEAVLAASR